MSTNLRLAMVFLTVIMLIGCSSNASIQRENSLQTEECNLTVYKNSAVPVMQEFSTIVKKIEIRDSDSRKNARFQLIALQRKAEAVKCKDKYPLKQETLEFSIKHILDALDYCDKGNYEEMNNSINKSLVNVEAFQDWSQDVGE